MASSSETRNHGQNNEEPFTAPPELTELVYIIIDGNRYSREIIKNALYAYGMRNVVEVHDGIAALKILQKTRIDVILVNYELPLMTGIDFTMRVRRCEDIPDPEILLIMLSNNSEKGKIIAARNAGVHEFLAKPLSPQTLYKHIRTNIFNPRKFLRTETYVGPDRRWENVGSPDGVEQRTDGDQS